MKRRFALGEGDEDSRRRADEAGEDDGAGTGPGFGEDNGGNGTLDALDKYSGVVFYGHVGHCADLTVLAGGIVGGVAVGDLDRHETDEHQAHQAG